MFIRPCFIRKNTPELREKLEELGYINGGKERTYGEHDSLYCNGYFGRYYECVQKPSRYESTIDCGTNEELFLTLAALRDDTSKNQHCIDSEGNWFLYNRTFVSLLSKTNVTWHKATVEEIIEHFKDK